MKDIEHYKKKVSNKELIEMANNYETIKEAKKIMNCINNLKANKKKLHEVNSLLTTLEKRINEKIELFSKEKLTTKELIEFSHYVGSSFDFDVGIQNLRDYVELSKE